MIKPQIVNKLKSITEIKLLNYLHTLDEWKHTEENRKFLADHLFIAQVTVKTVLRGLVDKGFVEKLGKGVYRLNKGIVQ